MAPKEDPRIGRDAACLEGLVRNPEEESDTPDALMREHLEAARFYLLGAMPKEYELSIKMIEQLLPEVTDKDLQNRIKKFLDSREYRDPATCAV